MFSGIIQEIGTILSQSPLTITLSNQKNLKVGASISVDGVCLTVTSILDDSVTFDLSMETLQLTTLGQKGVGDKVNLERALCYGDEIGGHMVSGHVGTTTTLLEKGEVWRFTLPAIPYLFYKGFVTLNGVSLTIASLDEESFGVAFIPETLRQTTFKDMEVGTKVNLEWDQLTAAAVNTVKSGLVAPT